MNEFLYDNRITVSATSSAFFSITTGYPFDSVKTRMQAYKYKSTLACIQSTWYLEGIRGFYRGVFPLMATTTTLRAISWNLYTQSRDKLRHGTQGITGAVVPCFLAGCKTGMIMSVFGAPLEFIKVQRQLSRLNGGVERNLFGWIQHVLKIKGPLGLYSGYRFHFPVETFGIVR